METSENNLMEGIEQEPAAVGSEIDCVKSERGRDILSVDSFLFWKHQSTKKDPNIVWWMCARCESGCKARLKTRKLRIVQGIGGVNSERHCILCMPRIGHNHSGDFDSAEPNYPQPTLMSFIPFN